MSMGRIASRPTTGVLAHTYSGHSDGAFPVLYAWMRLEAHLPADKAFCEAVARASHASRAGVDVRDLLPEQPHK